MTSLQNNITVTIQITEQKTPSTVPSSDEDSGCVACLRKVFSCCFEKEQTIIQVKRKQQVEYLRPVSVSGMNESPSHILSSVKYDSQNLIRSSSQNNNSISRPSAPQSSQQRPMITVYDQTRQNTTPPSRQLESISISEKNSPSSKT